MLRQGFVFAAALWLALPATASAQAGAAVIAGTVRDTSGGAIPGATVRIVNQQTRSAVDAISDAQGGYRREALTPGAYRIEITLSGFQTAVREVALADGQTAAIELTLVPAGLTEGVVVTARRVEEAAQD